jgi:hypothetical protein
MGMGRAILPLADAILEPADSGYLRGLFKTRYAIINFARYSIGTDPCSGGFGFIWGNAFTAPLHRCPLQALSRTAI